MRPEAEQEIRRRLRRALSAAKIADRYAERASMLADAAFRILEHNERMFSAEAHRADKAYKAHQKLSDARGALGDAVHQLERASTSAKTTSRDALRRQTKTKRRRRGS